MGFSLMDLKKIDWVVLKRYTSGQAVKDLDRFLDAIPMTVGHTALAAAGMVWVLAASAVFFTSVETGKVSKMNADLMQVEALRPPIPTIQYMPVSDVVLKPLAEKISSTYKGITISTGEGMATLSGQDTDFFPQFLAAISYFQRGGRNWKVRVDKMCVGTGCVGAKLSASLKIESVRIGEPEKSIVSDK